MSRLRLCWLLLALVVLELSACQVDVAVDLDVDASGGGTASVRALFDAEADRVIGDIAAQLRVEDLEQAGWDVTVIAADDGSTTVQVDKAVGGPDHWQGVLDEIAGPGVFRDVAVVTDDSFAETKQTLSFTLDLAQGWDLFSDQGVVDALRGEPFGAPIETLTEGRSIDEIIAIGLGVAVAADDTTSASTASFTPRFDDAEPIHVNLTGLAQNSTAVLLRWIATALFALFVLATVLAITGIVLQRRADRLRPAPTPASLASRVPGAALSAVRSVPGVVSSAPASESVRLVVLNPLTVLYQQSLSIDNYLLPFVRQNGGKARADEILDAYQQVLGGSVPTEMLWERCGVEGTTVSVDATFAHERSLRPGAADFLAEMQRRRIPVAGVSNDAATWSEYMRERDRLSAVWPWLVSSEVGTGTTDSAMFEVLRRESGVAHSHCLYVDTDRASLDVAKELGMKTALFDTGDRDLPELVGHPVVTDFKALFRHGKSQRT